MSVCPSCGTEVEDLDGFGVLAHDECGYCSHPSMTGTALYRGGRKIWKCDACSALVVDMDQEPVTKGLVPLLPRGGS